MVLRPYHQKNDGKSVPLYAAGIYHPPKVDIIPKLYHPFRKERISLKNLFCPVDKSGFLHGAGNRTRLNQGSPRSSPRRRRSSASHFMGSSPVLSCGNIKEEAIGLLFYFWCGQQDSNLHACALEPKGDVTLVKVYDQEKSILRKKQSTVSSGCSYTLAHYCKPCAFC